jgi:hypothetical protein
MVAERVLDPTEAPPVLFPNRADHCGTGRHRAVDHGIGILDDQQHPHRGSSQRLGAEVPVRRRLVGDPEGCVSHGELGDHGLVVVGAADPIHLVGPEGRLVELDGGPTAPHRELGLDRLMRVHGVTLDRRGTHLIVGPTEPAVAFRHMLGVERNGEGKEPWLCR